MDEANEKIIRKLKAKWLAKISISCAETEILTES